MSRNRGRTAVLEGCPHRERATARACAGARSCGPRREEREQLIIRVAFLSRPHIFPGQVGLVLHPTFVLDPGFNDRPMRAEDMKKIDKKADKKAGEISVE